MHGVNTCSTPHGGHMNNCHLHNLPYKASSRESSVTSGIVTEHNPYSNTGMWRKNAAYVPNITHVTVAVHISQKKESVSVIVIPLFGSCGSCAASSHSQDQTRRCSRVPLCVAVVCPEL